MLLFSVANNDKITDRQMAIFFFHTSLCGVRTEAHISFNGLREKKSRKNFAADYAIHQKPREMLNHLKFQTRRSTRH